MCNIKQIKGIGRAILRIGKVAHIRDMSWCEFACDLRIYSRTHGILQGAVP